MVLCVSYYIYTINDPIWSKMPVASVPVSMILEIRNIPYEFALRSTMKLSSIRRLWS
jgi:hypothetical protein